jgi:DNA polymerase-2
MADLTGWLLDLYEDRNNGLVVWLVGDDGIRRRLHQPFPITFYAAGTNGQLRALWRWLKVQPEQLRLERGERRDLFQKEPVTVLTVTVLNTAEQAPLFRRISEAYPDLTYYDADLQLSLRYAAATGAFPLAHCRSEAGEDGLIHSLRALDSPWDLDPALPELNVMHLAPDCDPNHAAPAALNLRCGRHAYRLPFEPLRPFLINLRALLERFDPDLLLSEWGDTWLLPQLFRLAEKGGMPLPLNREPGRGVTVKGERTYFSYGQIIFKGQQVHLFGRCHIDQRNAMLWGDYGLEGTLEAARVTCLPLQTAARVSPGTGISSMQILVALRNQVLVPWHKQQVEQPKTARQLLQRDQGGMIYQPITGLHEDVGMVDFISMYPSIMVHCNISPEVPPPTELGVSEHPPGLIAQTLGPLLEKRIALKQRSASLPPWDPRHAKDKARSQAYKWLLVTCFGYLGYKNARFGRIEAHEAVTSWGREALLRAKEAAEDMGFEVLHMYVDGLWVKKAGCRQPADYTDLLAEISRRTHLPVGLDGVFRWVAFLPSRVDGRVPVPNRYFGMYQDGSFKVRGVDVRRRDTPAFIGEAQMELLECLGGAVTGEELRRCIPAAVELLKCRVRQLRAGRVPLEQLLVAQKLSRELGAYKDLPPAARAAAQLEAIGKHVRPGQRVRFLLLRGHRSVHAWDLPTRPDPRRLDSERYAGLMIRAASNIFQPLGVSEEHLTEWVLGLGVAEGMAFGLEKRSRTSAGMKNRVVSTPTPGLQ